MVVKVFAVYDCKSKTYDQPWFILTTPMAVREFGTHVNNPKTKWNLYPADFTLFELGEFDDISGKLTSLPTPISLGKAQEYKKEEIRNGEQVRETA